MIFHKTGLLTYCLTNKEATSGLSYVGRSRISSHCHNCEQGCLVATLAQEIWS
ncbi:hypothetical protein LINGRAHAP2_LOCUS8712 [Linum grandiflorum]